MLQMPLKNHSESQKYLSVNSSYKNHFCLSIYFSANLELLTQKIKFVENILPLRPSKM